MGNHFKNNAEKSKFNTRVHNERRWDAFIELRERLKREGVKAIIAWRVAAQSFPPLDGSPLEVGPPAIDELPPHMRKPAAGSPATSASPTADVTAHTTGPVAEQPPAAEATAVEDEGSQIDGSGWWVDDKGNVIDADEQPPTIKARGGYVPVQAEVLPASVLADNKVYEDIVSEMDPGVNAALPAILNWVFNHYLVPIRKVNRANIPTTGALGLLKAIQASPTNFVDKFLPMWAKMIPTKSDLDKEGRFNDDGRPVLSLLDQFEQSLAGVREMEGEAA